MSLLNKKIKEDIKYIKEDIKLSLSLFLVKRFKVDPFDM